MTKIYQVVKGVAGDALWALDGTEGMFFDIVAKETYTALTGENVVGYAFQEGKTKLITHREALDLLAHWPAGHAELAKILADDPDSEFAVTDNERKP